MWLAVRRALVSEFLAVGLEAVRAVDHPVQVGTAHTKLFANPTQQDVSEVRIAVGEHDRDGSHSSERQLKPLMVWISPLGEGREPELR